jgi:hypothetical protein
MVVPREGSMMRLVPIWETLSPQIHPGIPGNLGNIHINAQIDPIRHIPQIDHHHLLEGLEHSLPGSG